MYWGLYVCFSCYPFVFVCFFYSEGSSEYIGFNFHVTANYPRKKQTCGYEKIIRLIRLADYYFSTANGSNPDLVLDACSCISPSSQCTLQHGFHYLYFSIQLTTMSHNKQYISRFRKNPLTLIKFTSVSYQSNQQELVTAHTAPVFHI